MKKKPNPLQVVPGGKPPKAEKPVDAGLEYVCSKLIVACVIDVWQNGHKVDEFVTQAAPVLCNGKGDTVFGSAVDALIGQLVERTKAGQLAPVPPPTE